MPLIANPMTYTEACQKARTTTLQPDYKGCSLHLNALLGIGSDGLPCIKGYTTSDWSDGTTVLTFVNGEVRHIIGD
jgi:hypothetical protein